VYYQEKNMSVPILTFFNNKGGVGKTSLVYHLAWMYAKLQKRVVAVDLDPQANLTAAFLTEDQIEVLWEKQSPGSTIYDCVRPLTDVGDIIQPELQNISANLFLIPGAVELSGFEDTLSEVWPKSMNDNNLYRPLRILSSFWQIMQMAAEKVSAEIILVDVGPNMGAINRSVLLAADYVVIPLGADLFSLQGLKNLGPTLRSWREGWNKRLTNWEVSLSRKDYPEFILPGGNMQVLGYLCQQYGVRMDRPTLAYDKWVQKIPRTYREAVELDDITANVQQQNDHFCLGTIKHYRSLVPMAQEHRKPIFELSSADGAIGSHANAVVTARNDFKLLAEKLAGKMSIQL
jgi:cellulose biosynthesis protein BcsQ